MTTMTLRRPVVTAVTNQPDNIDGATTAQQKGGRAETKTYMNNSRRMTSVQFYHNATEKGRAQTKLTWTSTLLIISLFSLYVKMCFTMLVLDSLSLADILAGAYFSQQENLRFRIHLLSQ